MRRVGQFELSNGSGENFEADDSLFSPSEGDTICSDGMEEVTEHP